VSVAASNVSSMPIWLTSVLLPIGVSVATFVVLGLTVGPRLAARTKRIQAVHDDRDRFGAGVLDILALCGNLEQITIPPDAIDERRARLQAERDRWLTQIDEITAWLADHWQRVALSYAGAMGVRDLVARYIGAARGLWLSGRPLDERVRMLRELTEPVQTIYHASRWRVVASMSGEITRLRTMLDSLDNSAAQPKAGS
jgi:hypothetical protein